MMKKTKTLAALGIFLSGLVLGFGVWVSAQEATSNRAIQLKESERDFNFNTDTALNPTGATLRSGPVRGKETGGTLTAKEFNRMLELATEGGSGVDGITCGAGEVMVGIGAGGEPSCLQIFTETVEDEGLYFGGMYGYSGSGSQNRNPLAGNTMGCPAGYTAQQVTGAGGWPGDKNSYYCYARPEDGVAPVAHFGGMYGVRATGNGYIVNYFNNPLAGNTYACPAGYTASKVLKHGTFDRELYFCYSTDLTQDKIESFQGMYSSSNPLYINPKTGGQSCPAGAKTAQVWGSQFDKNVFICYGDVAGGGTTTTVVSGGGTGTPLTYVNFDGSDCTTNGDECVIRKSNNVSRVVRESQGVFSIYFDTAFSDDDYVVFGTSSYGPTTRGTSVEIQTENTIHPDHVTIEVTHVDSDPSPADRPLVHVMMYDGSPVAGGAGAGGAFHLCNQDGTAVSGTDEACTDAQTDSGRGTDRYRFVNCQTPYSSMTLGAQGRYSGGKWTIASGNTDCNDGTILVADLQGTGGVGGDGSVASQVCPDGDYVKGFDDDGDMICEPLPASLIDGGTDLGNDSLPTLLYVLNDNSQTALPACVNDVDLEEYCGDTDGCTIRLLMSSKTDGSDQVRIIDEHIYMEEPGVFSEDNQASTVYGFTRQGGGWDNGWINGTGGTRRDSIFAPWDWVSMYNYKNSECTASGNHEYYPASEPYLFSFKAHRNIRAKIFIYDRLNEAPVKRWDPSCEEQGGNLLPGDVCDFSGTVNVTGLDTSSSSEKCYVTIDCPNGDTVTGIRFGKDGWSLAKCHAAFGAGFPRYCGILKDGSDFDITWTTDSEGRDGWAGSFDLK